MAETGLAVIERDAAERAARRLMEQAREALPPELAYLADGLMADAVVKAVEFARHSVSESTEKIYADDWNAFRGAPGRGSVLSLRMRGTDGA